VTRAPGTKAGRAENAASPGVNRLNRCETQTDGAQQRRPFFGALWRIPACYIFRLIYVRQTWGELIPARMKNMMTRGIENS
jgi:hypothetical protein